jgi:hypothetical protein
MAACFVTTDAQVMIPATVDWMKGWQRSRDAALAFKDACMAGDTATAASYVAENINEKVESICAQMRATSMTLQIYSGEPYNHSW